MSNQSAEFWENFQSKKFSEAQIHFDKLNDTDKQAIWAELFQKSAFQRKPFMVSVLRGHLHENKSFDDFYKAWLPQDLCNSVEVHGQVYHQGFPTPVRVINAVNANNPNDIVSIGITWVSNKEEEKKFWDYFDKVLKKEDEINEI
ncbi:MAG: hypothetical protein ACK4PR_08475, partial [Gammaproteobacteria bacterium]